MGKLVVAAAVRAATYHTASLSSWRGSVGPCPWHTRFAYAGPRRYPTRRRRRATTPTRPDRPILMIHERYRQRAGEDAVFDAELGAPAPDGSRRHDVGGRQRGHPRGSPSVAPARAARGSRRSGRHARPEAGQEADSRTARSTSCTPTIRFPCSRRRSTGRPHRSRRGRGADDPQLSNDVPGCDPLPRRTALRGLRGSDRAVASGACTPATAGLRAQYLRVAVLVASHRVRPGAGGMSTHSSH